MSSPVRVFHEVLTLPTYEPAAPDRNPMFLEKRVYQGSSGKVYPLPYYDRISDKPTPRGWKAIIIENDLVRVTLLPEIGGRIHAFYDKVAGYDLIYNQAVIKPALVGLAGPWASGGIEFNWPQHHRPATFMPVETNVEMHDDGSATVWMSDHDPMLRMKGMHGVRLHPDRSTLELRVRLYNRTPLTQTFLWWANVATKVHDEYQSFFPPDVTYVADHARRAMTEYPLSQGTYYGVNYSERMHRPRNSQQATRNSPNDLSWYANIPVPTSYMCMGSREDFFGGYDHRARAGIVHVANHHIAPGKKQWTWGNHPFGHAWDRNLTDADERGAYHPYIEIMAGVYTDNQPDFSFLAPGETKTFSQFWYPIQEIGAVQKANVDAAVSLAVMGKTARLGICVTRAFKGATVSLVARASSPWVAGAKHMGKMPMPRLTLQTDLLPGQPLVKTFKFKSADHLRLTVSDAAGLEIISYAPTPPPKTPVPPAATEPPAPAEVASSDELYTIGLHLEQYRHATRAPDLYWHEALRRDPGDARCNTALGAWHLRRGEFDLADTHLRAAIARQTSRNANPYDGEAHYLLGITLRYLGRDDDAYDALYKSTWNAAWKAAGMHALAEIDATRRDWPAALEKLNELLRFNTDNLRARSLKIIALRKLGRTEEADMLLEFTRNLDPLDAWSRHLAGEELADAQTTLDVALDLARAGEWVQAIGLVAGAKPNGIDGVGPMQHYYLAWLCVRMGETKTAREQLKLAAKADISYGFPHRVEEYVMLRELAEISPKDPHIPYLRGNFLYDRKRHEEAIVAWERAARLGARDATVWRNLGIAYFNVRHDGRKARACYERAVATDPCDARLIFERDQLWKRLGESPQLRLKELEKRRPVVAQRDDLTLELCGLYTQTGHPERALALLESRVFQPWEGGEGQALGQYVRAQLALGRRALKSNDAPSALQHFQSALDTPPNLGEARHLLANASDVHYHLGLAHRAIGDTKSATHHFKVAADAQGDFQNMAVQAFSEMTYFGALAQRELPGSKRTGRKTVLRELLVYAEKLADAPAKIDYFATSLPTMLLFNDDLDARQKTHAMLLKAQALVGLGRRSQGKKLLQKILDRDPSHALAADLLAELH
jgi:tetratricopeptide (TPR) repeat protein